jgi:hypothetical protein
MSANHQVVRLVVRKIVGAMFVSPHGLLSVERRAAKETEVTV